MHCLQESRIIIKLGDDKKSIYATRCCFKPEEVNGGISFEQLNQLRKMKISDADSNNCVDSYCGVGRWSKDVFKKIPKNHSYAVYSYCQTTSKKCFTKEMPFRTVCLNFSHACNLKCKHCNYEKFYSQEVQDEYFKAICDLIPVYCNIAFTEEGEPFFEKERLLSLLPYFSGEKHKVFHFTTNATLLNTEDLKYLSETAKKTGVYYSIIISCDAIDAETYKEIRGIDAFDRVISNIKTLYELSKENTFIGLDGINFVLQQENAHQAGQVYNFFDELFPNLSKKVTIVPIQNSEFSQEAYKVGKKLKLWENKLDI
jgi:sulfatase maturation enzyme AslB (radical SAM superfamily)